MNAEEKIIESGSDLFGFSNPEVRKLIQVLHLLTLMFAFG